MEGMVFGVTARVSFFNDYLIRIFYEHYEL
jgi:hypothetical protein